MTNITAERIKQRRKELGLSQEELAKRLNVERSTVCKWETGDNNLKQSKLKQLADALFCSPVWLIGIEDREAPDYLPGTSELIDLYSRATPEQRAAVINLLRSFVQE